MVKVGEYLARFLTGLMIVLAIIERRNSAMKKNKQTVYAISKPGSVTYVREKKERRGDSETLPTDLGAVRMAISFANNTKNVIIIMTSSN